MPRTNELARGALVLGALTAGVLVAVAAAAQPAHLTREPVADAPVVAPIDGESAASRAQREVVERWARLRALRVTYGERHPNVVRERVMLAGVERDLLELQATIDHVAVLAWVRAQRAEAERRLLALSGRDGTAHPELASARARRDALLEAERAIEAGRVFSPRP